MSVIQPLAPKTCPQCDTEGFIVIDESGWHCQLCGYSPTSEDKAPTADEPPTVTSPQRKFNATMQITHPGKIDPWARASYNTAIDCIQDENWDEAINALERALGTQHDFIDAHLWLARLVDDEARKRDHLGKIIAMMPSHAEAIEELMLLDGKLTEQEAARLTPYHNPQQREAGASVQAQTAVPVCPRCGGAMTTNDESGLVMCDFWGTVQKTAQQAKNGPASFTMALLKQRAQPVKWVIGERFIECKNCGAQRTIAGSKLSSHCLFCGSTQVIVQDALQSFRQPDGIVRFRVGREQAGAAIRQQVKTGIERIKGWFVNNRIDRATLQGVYLPYWVFDSVIDVVISVTDRRTSGETLPYSQRSETAMENNLAICAVKSPPPKLTGKLGKFTFYDQVDYKPDLINRFPAELYTMDFDKAAMEARSVISQRMRQKHADNIMNPDVDTNVFSTIRHMTFQLVLLPVWVGTLIEEDGDVRTALVNGQTGKVALGRAARPDRG